MRPLFVAAGNRDGGNMWYMYSGGNKKSVSKAESKRKKKIKDEGSAKRRDL